MGSRREKFIRSNIRNDLEVGYTETIFSAQVSFMDTHSCSFIYNLLLFFLLRKQSHEFLSNSSEGVNQYFTILHVPYSLCGLLKRISKFISRQLTKLKLYISIISTSAVACNTLRVNGQLHFRIVI